MKKIKTTGDLRAFLADAMDGVMSGTVEPDTARNVTKLAAQINESFYSEIKIAKIQNEIGEKTQKLGSLSIE